VSDPTPAAREEIAYARGMAHGMELADAFRRGPQCGQKRAQAIESLKAYRLALDAVVEPGALQRARRDRLRDRLMTNAMGM
jgi:hypothetical protein